MATTLLFRLGGCSRGALVCFAGACDLRTEHMPRHGSFRGSCSFLGMSGYDLWMTTLKRSENRDRIRDDARFDVVVIGGGATGLGSGVDAAARGYRTLVLEAGDFASGTSSKSTKLIHGGVRYLAQGNLRLVREALHERAILLGNAPHLVHRRSFLVPAYRFYDRTYYGLGLAAYDLLSGSGAFARSQRLSADEALARIPRLSKRGLRGGVLYEDGQFDDARFAVALARTLVALGGTALNYARVEAIEKREGRVCGVSAQDLETGEILKVQAAAVVNAAGVQVDAVRRLDDAAAAQLLTPSQGAHLVFDTGYLGGETAVLVPRTDDGRVLFAIPWLGRLVVGTTDTPVDRVSPDPRPFEEEVDFLIEHLARYLDPAPGREQVLSSFAGLRPLVSGRPGAGTSVLSREHAVVVDRSGLVTITGGKWTSYRRMAADAIDKAAQVGGLSARASRTAELKLDGWALSRNGDLANAFGAYAGAVDEVCRERREWGEPIAPGFANRLGEAAWSARHEGARTVEDVLARRMRLLFLDARAAAGAAAAVAGVLRSELGRDEEWERAQVLEFQKLAASRLP